jgi:HK97 family phage major capsid protein
MDTYIEKRSNTAKAMRDMLDLAKGEKRSLIADEKVKYDNMVAEIERLDEEEKRESALRKIEAKLNEIPEPQTTGKEERSTIDPKIEQRREFREFLAKGKIPEERVMTTETGSTGGFLIPEIFADMLLEYAKNDAIIRSLATVKRWRGDGAFPVVSAFGTSYLVGEGDEVTTTTITIGQQTVSGFQLMWRTEVPVKLINNSAYDLESVLMRAWAKSNSNLEEGYWADGAGTTTPIGLTAAGTDGTDTAANNAIAADDVVTWYYDLPQAYRNNASWIFADATVARIRKIKNPVNTSGATNYVWMPGLAGVPDTLMGRPIYASAGMPAFAAGASVGVFGDISQYQIVEFGSPKMIRDPYTVATYNQVRFVGARLVDAALPVAEAVIVCNIAS